MTPSPNNSLNEASDVDKIAAKKKKASYKVTMRSAASDATSGPIITALHPYDVILGRGAPTAFYEGNIKFRTLAALHKDSYMAGGRHHPKQAIALQVLDEVHKLGGRFVSEVAGSGSVPKSQAKQFRVVSHEVALEKVKQALRAKGSCDDVPMASTDTAGPSAAVIPPFTTVTAPEEDERKPAAVTTTLPTAVASTVTYPARRDPTPNHHPLPMSIESVLSNTAVHPEPTAESDSDDEEQASAPAVQSNTDTATPSLLSIQTNAAAALVGSPHASHVASHSAPSVDSISSLQNVLLARQILSQRQSNLRQQQQVDLLNLQAALLQQQHQQQQQQAQQQLQRLLQPQPPQQQQLVWNTSTPTMPWGAANASLLPSVGVAQVAAAPAATHWLSNVLGLGNNVSSLLGTAGLLQQPQPPMTASTLLHGWNAMAPTSASTVAGLPLPGTSTALLAALTQPAPLAATPTTALSGLPLGSGAPSAHAFLGALASLQATTPNASSPMPPT